jgi:hyperosmotically inducible periplasmic protein
MKLSNKFVLVGISIFLTLGMLACNKGPDDATITSNVKAKLTADTSLTDSTINVDTKDGVVTLGGMVNTDGGKPKAEQIAKTVEGVKSVTNNLAVKPPPPVVTISPDTQLKNDVSAALTKYGITGVAVEVANGEVTLTGDIARAKLQDAMKAANEARPKKVNNRMNIK